MFRFRMIPRGICLDLETTIAAKIPDTVRPAGQKRFETRIIEIGACHWTDITNTFMRLVNPITHKCTSGANLIQHLTDIHQQPGPTLNFWSRVLVRRKSVDRTMFTIPESPEVWLARRTESKAEDFVRWFNGEHGPQFVSESQALQDLLTWSGNHPWLAHNGRSFDFKVLKGASLRTDIPLNPSIVEHDTLKLFRKIIPGHKSYSQPILYENIFSEKYNAHVAIDDALALARLCQHVASENVQTYKSALLTPKVTHKTTHKTTAKVTSKTTTRKAMKTRKAMNLTFESPNALKSVAKQSFIANPKIGPKSIASLYGIGPKSVAALSKDNVFSIKDLVNSYNSGGNEWLKTVLPFGANWKSVAKCIHKL